MTTRVSMSAMSVSQSNKSIKAHAPRAPSTGARASIASHAAPQLGNIEDHRPQASVNIPSTNPGPKFSGGGVEIGARRAARPGGVRYRQPAIFADSEVCPDQNMKRRMLGPIFSELFEVEESHLVDYGLAVTTGSGEEAVYPSPAVRAAVIRS